MGRFQRRLILEERQSSSDGAGGREELWVTLTELWADITARSAREGFAGGQGVSRVSHRAQIRFIPFGDPKRPKPDQRFREGGRVFAIIGVSEADERRGLLTCWLEEGALT